MAESILQRVSRVLNARLEDAVDRMERSGSGSVMREAIREVDRVIDDVQADLELATTQRLRAIRQQKALQDKIRELTDKAKFAVAEGRDDLAEAALSREMTFEAQAETLDGVRHGAAEDEARLGDSLGVLKARRKEMEDALSGFLASRRDSASGEEEPAKAPRGIERRVYRAEQAFDRAMTNAGGEGFSRADGDTVKRVAEIDVMQKRSAVAARLQALKQQVGAA